MEEKWKEREVRGTGEESSVHQLTSLTFQTKIGILGNCLGLICKAECWKISV